MTLEQLQKDMIQAMKTNKPILKDVLKELIGAVKNAGIEKKCKDNIPEELVNQAILKQKKITEEMIETCPAERHLLLTDYKARLAIIENYCPKLLDNPEEISAIVIGELAAAGVESVKANKGAVMKTLMPIFKGKADMKIVNQVIMEELI
jgi:uncharacterized protein YqeY